MKIERNDYQKSEISDEMICSIVSLAATGVNGIERISLRVTDEILDKLYLTTTVKGVKIGHKKDKVIIGVYLITEPGVDILKVSKEVQLKIKESVETMAGLMVDTVNVRIEGSGL
ncbi:MAG: Asp23/Gls24 family envelope stress response protein [Eubacteriaceae bacterium]